ncbi:hypothetical protein Scep_026576 [Stephania cephalantha]|uniref:Uncharacterized protein n=1 Tax=Stephania cephalantha TaxID=152367 RepID=A0AAP0ENK1_9MAGN
MGKAKQEDGGGVVGCERFCRRGILGISGLIFGAQVNWLVPTLTGCLHETVGCP